MEMELRPDKNKPIEMIAKADEYMRVAFIYILLALASVAIYFFLCKNVVFFLFAGTSIAAAVFMYVNYMILGKKQYKLDDCFIKVDGKFIECKQLNDGKYEHIKIAHEDIKQTMDVDEGIQIWFDPDTTSSFFFIDNQKVKRSIALINFFAYDIQEVMELHATIVAYAPEDSKHEDMGHNWKEDEEKTDTFKMLIPSALFLVAAIIYYIVG